jgi:hypothetical protein
VFFLLKTCLCSSSIELIQKSTQNKLRPPSTTPTSKSSTHPPQPPRKANNDPHRRSCSTAIMLTDTAPEKRFPKPTLAKITTKPNHQTLSALEQELNSNTISVKSTRGGGSVHGHLIITISATKYLALTGIPFVAMEHPGDGPYHGANPSAARMVETNRTYDKALN